MTSAAANRDEARLARALGVKLPVYRHLCEAFAAGEHTSWLRVGDPALAGLFPNALGFEVLCERLHAEESLERRRANVLKLLEGKERPELEAAVGDAADEGELEDLVLAVEPASPPANWEKPEKEEHAAFLDRLRGDAGLARELRRLFREKALVKAEMNEKKGADTRHYAQFAGMEEPLLALRPDKYLQLRRGEHLHAIKLRFELPAAEIRGIFDQGIEGVPPQEKDAYLKLYLEYVDRERLPRLAQEARARLKRNAENLALQQAWSQLETSLGRGRHDGLVLGICSLRASKLMLALIDGEGHLQRTVALPARAEDLGDRLAAFLGEDRPALAGVQADAATRNAATPLLQKLREGGRVRSAPVPLAVVRTMLREVARRPDETHLTHDERQALMVARLAWHPRASAYHTPHLVRAYIAYRGEINPRRLEHFEKSFLQEMLLERGVDANHGTRDELRLVPGLDAESVLFERSTAPFRSLEDFQARMGLLPADWRAAMCFLRVRGGDEILDTKPLHPVYYPVLRSQAQAKGVELAEIFKDPAQVETLEWEQALQDRGWPKGVVARVRQSLTRPGRRPRKNTRAPAGQRLEALEVGATLRGTISTLLPYGAFVNVGARREGLVHISEMADRFVKDPAEVVQVGQEVTVRVLSVDVENQRFRLSMRPPAEKGEEAGAGRPGQGRGGRPGSGGRGGRPGSGGGGGRGGPDSRGRGGPSGGRGRRRDEQFAGADPRAKREEIDPTNPFFQFFKENALPAAEAGKAAEPAKTAGTAKSGDDDDSGAA